MTVNFCYVVLLTVSQPCYSADVFIRIWRVSNRSKDYKQKTWWYTVWIILLFDAVYDAFTCTVYIHIVDTLLCMLRYFIENGCIMDWNLWCFYLWFQFFFIPPIKWWWLRLSKTSFILPQIPCGCPQSGDVGHRVYVFILLSVWFWRSVVVLLS